MLDKVRVDKQGQTESRERPNSKKLISWMWLYTGTRYIVVDCGGGTVDITAHEMESTRGDLHEIYKATGGPHGSVGQSVSICNRQALLRRSVCLAYAPPHRGGSQCGN